LIVFRISGVRTDDMHRNEKSTRQNSVRQIIVRLCFVLSLWQGPFPWLHCHQSELVELTSPESLSELCHHLATFHDGAGLGRDHEFGWHFHWILPNWNCVFHDPSHDDQPVKDFVSLDSIAVCSTNPTFIERLIEGDLFQLPTINQFTETRPTIWRIERVQLSRRYRELSLVLRC
jgi:hypothetical protein